MRLPASLAVSLCLIAISPLGSAATMYKCVDAKGKISYSDIECQGASKQAKAIEVTAPAPSAERDARLKAEAVRLREAAVGFNQRMWAREQGEAQREEAAHMKKMEDASRKASAAADEARAQAAHSKLIGEIAVRRRAEECQGRTPSGQRLPNC